MRIIGGREEFATIFPVFGSIKFLVSSYFLFSLCRELCPSLPFFPRIFFCTRFSLACEVVVGSLRNEEDPFSWEDCKLHFLISFTPSAQF